MLTSFIGSYSHWVDSHLNIIQPNRIPFGIVQLHDGMVGIQQNQEQITIMQLKTKLRGLYIVNGVNWEQRSSMKIDMFEVLLFKSIITKTNESTDILNSIQEYIRLFDTIPGMKMNLFTHCCLNNILVHQDNQGAYRWLNFFNETEIVFHEFEDWRNQAEEDPFPELSIEEEDYTNQTPSYVFHQDESSYLLENGSTSIGTFLPE